MTDAPLRFREVCLSLGLFIAVVALLFHDITLGGCTIASAPHSPFTRFEGPVGYERVERVPFSDASGAALTNEASVPYRRRALSAGGLPFWNPNTGCGQPYLAGHQPGFFFPLHFLMLAGPDPLGIDLTYLGRLVLAGWCMFLFLRTHRLGRRASFLAGVMYLGAGYLVTDVNSTNVSAECLVPGLLLALERLVTRARRWDFVLAVALVTLVLASGNPEAEFLGFLLGGFYALVRIVTSGSGGKLRLFGLVVAVHALGALVAAPLILPFLEFYGLSIHYHHVAQHEVVAPLGFLALFVNPGLFDQVDFGLPASVYGTGTIGCVLAGVGLLASRHRFLKIFIGSALLVTAAVYFDAPGFRELRALPLIRQFSLYKYPAAHLCLHLAVLAGLGVDSLVRGSARRPGRTLALAGVAVGMVPVLFTLIWDEVVAGFAFSGAGTYLQHPDPGQPEFGLLPWLLAAALGLGLLLARRPAFAGLAAAALIVLGCGEVYHHIPRPYPPRRDIYAPSAWISTLPKPYHAYRIYSTEFILAPDTASVFNLNDIRYFEVLKVDRYVKLIREAFDYPLATIGFNHAALRSGTPVRALRALGVRYVAGHEHLVPLARGPLPGGGRTDLGVDLRGGGGCLAATVVVPPRQAGEVIVTLRSPAGFAASPIRTLEPGGVSTRVALEGLELEVPALAYLAVHFEPGACLDLALPVWDGQPTAIDALRAGSTVIQAMRGYYPTDVFRPRPGGTFRAIRPFLLALPTPVENRGSELVLRARVVGPGPASVALVYHRAAEVRRVPFTNESESEPRRVPLRVDLAPFTGRAITLSLEIAGQARLENAHFVADGITRRRTVEGVSVHEVEHTRPRAYGVYEAEIVPEEAEQLARLLDLEFPIATRVILEKKPREHRPPAATTPVRPEVSWIHEDPSGGSLELEATFAADGFLVLLDNFYPGWQARVDGKPVEIVRANYTFRAVAVPAGTHRVQFDYRPTHWLLSLVLTALGLALTVGLAARMRAVRCPGSPRESGGS